MARKCKVGIDYFSHDVHCTSDRKLKLIKAKYGVIGYGVYFLILEEIYKEGYCLQIDDEFNILFISDHNLEEDVYINCLNDCIKFGLFNDNIYKKYSILTSKRIQENYIEATSRRKSIEIDVTILLIDVDILPDNINIGTQKKRKEIKGEEIKEDNKLSFDTFWDLYDKKVGKKDKIIKKWDSLKIEVQQRILDHVKKYKVSQPDKAFRKNPETYFNNESWNDEIILNNSYNKNNNYTPQKSPNFIGMKK